MNIDNINLLNGYQLINSNKNVNKSSNQRKAGNFKDKEEKQQVGEEIDYGCSSNDENVKENVRNYTFQDEFLSYERVAKKSQRSLAIINSDNYIQVIKKIGTWNNYGYSYMGQLYLHSYEALYLIETNRLELLYDSVIVSLEQAYCLFLQNGDTNDDDDGDGDDQQHQSDADDYSCKLNIQEYLVYSNFMKAGYIIRKYNAKNDQRNHHSVGHAITYKNDIILNERHKCIWNHLFMLNQKKSKYEIPDNELQLKVTQSFIDINEKMKNHSIDINVENDDLLSNDLLLITTRSQRQQLTKTSNDLLSTAATSSSSSTEPPPAKKLKLIEYENENKNPLDQLLDTIEYKQFESIFKKLQIINLPKLMVVNEDTDKDFIVNQNNENQNVLPLFHFDLYIDGNFKKSTPGIPKYRILILKKPPSRQFIVKRYLLQNHKVPILIIFVTESMNFNGFIYRFSM